MDLIERVKMLVRELKIEPVLKGKDIIDKEKIIKETLTSGSTAANPKKIEREDVEFLLREIFSGENL